MLTETFTPGTFKGVAHIVDLQGPKHLGSVAFGATNTSSFESGKGNEHWWLENDLQHEAMRAFDAERRKRSPDGRDGGPPRRQEVVPPRSESAHVFVAIEEAVLAMKDAPEITDALRCVVYDCARV
jgi:hypothetical protein